MNLTTAPDADLRQMSHPRYRRDIDGLRAIAVIAVVMFHAFPKWLKSGFIGVDIFFVISGYLIGTIIFNNLDNGSFSFRSFYARRIRRIFPALLITLLLTILGSWYILLPNEFAQLGKHTAGGMGFAANFTLWQEAGYFDTAADMKPLLHLWSLGIEEQFYIIWPLLLWLGWRWRRNRLVILVAVLLASFAVNAVLITTDVTAAFYSPLARFWELLVGSLLACYNLYHPRYFSRYRNWQAAGGCLLIVAALALLSKNNDFPGWWALLPTLGAFFIIAAGPDAWINRRILGSRILVATGLISFPWYLVHWPALSFAHVLSLNPSAWLRRGIVAGSFVIAALIYLGVEKNIRFRPGRRVVTALLALAILISALGVAMWGGIVKPRHADAQIERALAATRDWDFPPREFAPLKVAGRKFFQKITGRQKVLFLGDSHIEQYATRINQVLNEQPDHTKSVIFATQGGCLPVPHTFETNRYNCANTRDVALKLAARDDIDTIVLGACWNCYFATRLVPDSGYDYYFDKNGKKISYTKDSGIDASLHELQNFLTDLARHKKVYLVLDNMTGPGFDPANTFSGSRLGQLTFNTVQQAMHMDQFPALLQIRSRLIAIGKQAGVTLIDPVDYLCDAGTCPTTGPDGAPLYKDSDHLRASYARAHAGYIDQTVLLK